MGMPALKRKKVRAPIRRKTGLAAVPIDKGWESIKYYFHYEVDSKQVAEVIKAYVKKNWSKADAKSALACPEYKFKMFSHYAATAFMLDNPSFEFEGKLAEYPVALKRFVDGLVEEGKPLVKEKQEELASKNVIVLTPQQRMENKILETVGADLDELEDQWIMGEKTQLDMYNAMQRHDLKGMAVPFLVKRLTVWLEEYNDAYNKTCEQAVEAYSHITRKEQKRRIDAINKMLEDLEKFKNAAKAKRAPRKPKVKSADKQVAKMNYKKEDNDFKIASVNPTMLVGAGKVFLFNTKYRQLTCLITNSASKGFEVSGSTIKNVDDSVSWKMTLRKPEDILPLILSKTANQIDKAIAKLTTKKAKANGRVNNETVILRVL